MYITDLIAQIKSAGYKIIHFRSADLISNQDDQILVIYSYNGLTCSITHYKSSAEYGKHIGEVLESGITYKSALSKCLDIMKGFSS